MNARRYRKLILSPVWAAYAVLYLGMVIGFTAIYVAMMVAGVGQTASVLVAMIGLLIGGVLAMGFLCWITKGFERTFRLRIPDASAWFDFDPAPNQRPRRHEHGSHA